ncbi:1 3-beta-glucanosyltransferase [Pyrenophora tritici-repentis]|nr:1 3-beta-glucanosyltransferase [Pyrenophora tritici-repentis]KAI0581385.1 1-3-beta-glucanosyltransferase [Pyrenophora tritici-repentis]
MSASITCPPIRIRGRFLWRGDDRTKFFIRGVAYQVDSARDPISDDRLAELKHDILLFKELGLNTLFVYGIDSTKHHTEAMKLLEEAGIYVFTAVSTPWNAISRLAPTESYNPDTMASFFKTVDIMAGFPNTLGLLAGNTVINNDSTMPAAGVLKTAVRDLKKYMKLRNEANGQRVIPIGYSAATSSARDQEILEYLTAGDNDMSIDFWTCSNFEWKKKSDTTGSGYDDLLHRFSNTTIPIFFSEYGNPSRQPRLFQETTALYSPAMSRIFSGGCAYEFWESANGYGLLELLKHGSDKRISAYRQKPDDENKIFERRETDRGILLVFNDFVNYKSKLAEVGDIAVEDVSEATEREGEQGETGKKASGPWQDKFRMLESCVDWHEVEAS